jgi:hypothetical protein
VVLIDLTWASTFGAAGATGAKLIIADSTIVGAGKGVFLIEGVSVPPGTILTEVSGEKYMTAAEVDAMPDDDPRRQYMVEVDGTFVVGKPSLAAGTGLGMIVNHGGTLSNVHYVKISGRFFIESSVFLKGPCELMSDYGQNYVELFLRA